MRLIGLLMPLLLVGCAGRADLPPTCQLKPESGQCRAAHQRYWFDPDSSQCRAFIWGGCGGVVPFETLESCQQTCEPDASSAAAPRNPVRGY